MAFGVGCDTVIDKKDKAAHSVGIKKVVEFRIEKGSFLELTDKDNWEYPADFQTHNNRLYILSGLEKKIISYDLNEKHFFNYENIHRKLIQEKNKNDTTIVSSPLFLRIVNSNIILGYDFHIFVFDSTEEFLYKYCCKEHIQYISSSEKNQLNIWFNDHVIKLNIDDTNVKRTINYNSHLVNLAEHITSNGNEIASRHMLSALNESSVKTIILPYTPFNLIPELDESKFCLQAITNKYYIWYPFTKGSKIILVNRQTGAANMIELGLDITVDNLRTPEDLTGGLKMSINGNHLYLMVMVSEKSEKIIRVYSIDI